MLENLLTVYLLGCAIAVFPVMFLFIGHAQNKQSFPKIYYLFDVLQSWFFVFLFIFANIKLILKNKKEKAPFIKGTPESIPSTEDCTGFLNFSVKVFVETKNAAGGVNTILEQPLVMVLNQYMKDYGYKPEQYDENELRFGIALPTGSKCFFPYATKEPTK
jgi:hypothetical protein